MDIYQIFMTHNREWTIREMVCFAGLMAVVGCILTVCVRSQRIEKSQGVAIFVLFLFLGIVFGSTVFTRTVTVRHYELIPLWSWGEVIFRKDWELLQEIFLNILLLLPMGFLLPFAANHSISWRAAFGMGFLVSAAIELCQLIFMRGLFEWDDMLHNGLGCMLGCMLANATWKGRKG